MKRPTGKAGVAAVGDRLQDQRDAAIRGAHSHGVPSAAIARMLKMSVQRVSRIIES